MSRTIFLHGTRLALALLVASAASGCAPVVRGDAGAWVTPRRTTLPAGGVELASEWVDGVPVVRVRVNGHGPFRFLLDTGCTGLMLSEEVARRVGAPATNVRARMEGADMGRVRRVDVLEAGGAVFEGVDGFIPDLSAMRAAFGELDGVLGVGVFRETLLTIDYPNRRVRIDDGRLPPADGRDLVALRPAGNQIVAVPLRIGDVTLTAIVDSGNSGALRVDAAAADSLPLLAPPVDDPGPFATFSGFRNARVARLGRAVLLGGHDLGAPVVHVADGPALLGARLMNRFAVTLDLRNKVARFARLSASSRQ